MPDRWDGRERRENMPEIAALQESLDQVRAQLTEQNELTEAQNAAMVKQTQKLADVEEKLPTFVPKSRFRAVIGAVVLGLLILVAVGVMFRRRDDTEARRRREQIERDQEQDRQNNIAGCERANEQRAALRRTIERAYAPSSISDEVVASLPPTLRDALAQSAERQASQRAEQLADPGVQNVDCQAKYPPIKSQA